MEDNHESLVQNTIIMGSKLENNGEIIDPYGFNINMCTTTDQIINVSKPNVSFYDNHYAFVKCDIITTFWVKHTGFSYLNNPENTDDNFFLPLSDSGLTMDFWNEKVTKNKISMQTMITFVEQFNNEINDNKEIINKKQNLLKKTRLFFIFSICFFLVSITFLVFLIRTFFNFDEEKLIVLIIGFLISLLGFFILIFMSIIKNRKTEYILNKYIYLNYQDMGKFIKKWNNEKFLPTGIYVLVPINLKYVQFVLDKNIRFCLSNHQFPVHLKEDIKGK